MRVSLFFPYYLAVVGKKSPNIYANPAIPLGWPHNTDWTVWELQGQIKNQRNYFKYDLYIFILHSGHGLNNQHMSTFVCLFDLGTALKPIELLHYFFE